MQANFDGPGCQFGRIIGSCCSVAKNNARIHRQDEARNRGKNRGSVDDVDGARSATTKLEIRSTHAS